MQKRLSETTALSPAQPKGFTMQELLVVIGIIGLLVALAAPTIMYSREAARTTQTMNNMRQIIQTGIQHEETVNNGRGYQDPGIPGGSAAGAGPLSLFEVWAASTPEFSSYSLANNLGNFHQQPDGSDLHWPIARGGYVYDTTSNQYAGPWSLVKDPRRPELPGESPFALYVKPDNRFTFIHQDSNVPVMFTRVTRGNTAAINAPETMPVWNDSLPQNAAAQGISGATAVPGGSNAGFDAKDGVGLVGFPDGRVEKMTPAGLNKLRDKSLGRAP